LLFYFSHFPCFVFFLLSFFIPLFLLKMRYATLRTSCSYGC
jgi:hypothetical protein